MTAATCCNCVYYRYERHTHICDAHIPTDTDGEEDMTRLVAGLYSIVFVVVVVASAVVAGTVCFCFAAEMATGVQQNMLATATATAV